MEANLIYTRAFSSTSNRQLVSGRAQLAQFLSNPDRYPLSRRSLHWNFRNHADKYSEEPTSIVSVSNRILDTITRAYGLWQDGNDPGNVWIIFIRTRSPIDGLASPRIHHAETLAKQCGHWNPVIFQYEFVVEEAIPEHWVQHRVSLKTLMDRGLDWEKHLPCYLPNELTVGSHRSSKGYCVLPKPRIFLQHLRDSESEAHRSCTSAWEIGRSLSCITRCFGARAPMGWIMTQLLRELFLATVIHDSKQEFDEGTEFMLLDWVTSDDFIADFGYYENEKERLMWRYMDNEEENEAEDQTTTEQLELLEVEAVAMGF
ncbi:hypothetical protein PG991_006351 [Apiospora marii]|uniref:DUF7587 domain-containing protein n=1 Tax=Apiospora marii TaxID=335849 RepID=A0ABR1SD27_9PEZI